MRTKKEIEEYIKDSYWYDYFLENIVHTRGYKFILQGKNREWTVKAAFDWTDTDQGESYWKQVDKEFTEWYREV